MDMRSLKRNMGIQQAAVGAGANVQFIQEYAFQDRGNPRQNTQRVPVCRTERRRVKKSFSGRGVIQSLGSW